MRREMARVAALALMIVLLGGCAPRLTEPAGEMPDLRGTWKGTWGGTPCTLLVIEQPATVASGGIAIGPWPLFADRLPALAGVLTFTVRDEPVSVNVQGRFGGLSGRLTLVLDGLTPNGERLVLTRLSDDRLRGHGTSRPVWEPQGPVELRRVTSSRARE
jgi:hypothetical protein